MAVLCEIPGSAILGDYDIGTVRSFQTLSGGMFLRPTLLVADSGKYVLRGHRFRTTEHSFRFQAECLEHVRRGGVLCPRVIVDRHGRYGQPDGSVFWALHEFVEGKNYSWQDWRLATGDPVFVESLGFRIASVHNALRSAAPGGDPALPVSLPPIQFGHLDAIHDHWRRELDGVTTDTASQKALVEAREELESYWARLGQAVQTNAFHDLPRQLLHGDISPVNMLFSPEGKNFSLIDWDCVHVGPRIYDALGDVLNRPPAELAETCEFDAQAVRSYLRGYQRGAQQPLTSHELRSVPILCLARQLEDLRQRLHVLHNLPAEPDAAYAALIRGRVRMMRQILSRDTYGFEDIGRDF